MREDKVAVVVGVGPGLGAAVARRFAREGFTLGLVARKAESSEPVRAEIEQQGGAAGNDLEPAGPPVPLANPYAGVVLPHARASPPRDASAAGHK